MHTPQDKAALLSALLDKEMGDHATIKMFEIFVNICQLHRENEGVSQAFFLRRMGLHSSTLTRNLQALGTKPETKVKDLPGLGLIVLSPDPNDGRAKVIHLTARGRRLWNQVLAILV